MRGFDKTSSGFTLLEMVVALFLTSLVGLVAYSSLTLCLKATRRNQEESELRQQLRIGHTYLARSLSSAVPRNPSSGSGAMYFIGQGQELRCITAVPLEAHNLGGFYHFRVFVGQNQAGHKVLAVEQSHILNWQMATQEVELCQILVKNLSFARFSYVQKGEEYETWDAGRHQRLPDWVKVQLAMPGQPTQIWMMPIHAGQHW